MLACFWYAFYDRKNVNTCHVQKHITLSIHSFTIGLFKRPRVIILQFLLVFFYFDNTILNTPPVTLNSQYSMAKLAFGKNVQSLNFKLGMLFYESLKYSETENSIYDPEISSQSETENSIHDNEISSQSADVKCFNKNISELPNTKVSNYSSQESSEVNLDEILSIMQQHDNSFGTSHLTKERFFKRLKSIKTKTSWESFLNTAHKTNLRIKVQPTAIIRGKAEIIRSCKRLPIGKPPKGKHVPIDMSTRRYTDPINVKRIWNSIRSSKQIQVDYIKIIKYIQNDEECSPTQAELYVRQCLKDKLILLCKGNGKLSDPQTTFRITNQELPDFDDIDWYCFECHRAGEVKQCQKCHRVYHQHCILKARRRFDLYRKTNNYNLYKNKNVTAPADASINISSDSDEIFNVEEGGTENIANKVTSTADRQKEMTDKENYVYDENLCSVCNIKNVDTGCDLQKTEMNYLLKFVLDRIRSWLPNTITHTMAQEDRPEWLTDAELTWRANQLFFEHKDMSVIEVNLNNETYNLLADFLADVYNVQHNVAIFHGLESQEYGASELMIRDTLHDLMELKNCADCYKHSNEKINQKWFCLPCRNPHDLVWAKQKGYPYWPAKILRESDKHYDVRFFGGKYERAMLVKNLVKPISVPKETLQIKASAAFTKALEELEFHKLLLSNPEELEKIKANSKPTRKTLNKQRNSLLNVSPENLKKSANKKRTSTHQSNQFHETFSPESKGKKKRGRPFGTNQENTNNTSSEKKKKKSNDAEGESSISGNIIDISDGDDDEEQSEYSYRDSGFGNGPYLLEDGFEPVSSSTENFRNQEAVCSTSTENGMQRLDQPYCDAVEKMRRVLETLPDKKSIIKQAMSCMQLELDKITNTHNDTLKRLFESHNNQISETKKKQWCYHCEQDAIYHCCWNTAYCSQVCQQQHWQAEHKKVCRRKRPDGKE